MGDAYLGLRDHRQRNAWGKEQDSFVFILLLMKKGDLMQETEIETFKHREFSCSHVLSYFQSSRLSALTVKQTMRMTTKLLHSCFYMYFLVRVP